MKNNKKNNLGPGVYEVITPFGVGEEAVDGLFDDCPFCDELRQRIEAGEAIKVGWEDLDEEN